jgi:hypothetical protein
MNPQWAKEKKRIERLRLEDPAAYAAFREKERNRVRAWNAANPVKRRETQNNWKKKNPEKRRRWDRLSRGLPEPTRPAPQICECCGRPESRKGYVLALDHCHLSGKFRGWLCNNCNVALGKLGDTEAGVLNLLRYLRAVL